MSLRKTDAPKALSLFDYPSDQPLVHVQRGAPIVSGIATASELIELEKKVGDYILQNILLFNPEAYVQEGGRVLERDSGRVGTVVGGGKRYGGGAIFHPAIKYDDEPSVVDTSYNERHFIVIKEGVKLPPFPW